MAITTTRTTTRTDAETALGTVQCLICARTLARAARRTDGVTILRPRRPGTRIEVSCPDGTQLRCNLCGGRAYIDDDQAA